MAADANKNLHMETMEDATEKTLGSKEAGSAGREGLYVVEQPQGIRACHVKPNHGTHSYEAHTSQKGSAIASRPVCVSAYRMLLSFEPPYAERHVRWCERSEFSSSGWDSSYSIVHEFAEGQKKKIAFSE